MSAREPDVVVVGAGPAGSTVASLLRRFSPHAEVVLVEREGFPRHHIGESLVADVNRILFDVGAYDAVASAGFVPKTGSTFIWGRDREPWSIDFSKLGEIPGFSGAAGYQSEHTWHVRRHEYDALLLDHARALGAHVERASAEILLEDDRAVGVRLDDGRTLRPRFVVDATGQHSQLALRTARRTFDPELRNVAVYGYFEGAALDPTLSGTWEASRIAVVSVAEGWIWYIPLARGLISVGVVTSRDAMARRSGASLAEILDGAIRGCPELAPLLRSARRIRFAGADADVLAIRDYCYSVTPVTGPGWALAGDASGFVDPILSIGCYLAHAGAHWLAHGLATLLAGDAVSEELCFRAYAEQLQFSLRAFRRMTWMFYGFNETKESWWWEAKRILRERAFPASVDEKGAFLALATGYGINRSVVHEAISDFGVNLFDDLYRNLVAKDSPGSTIKRPGARARDPVVYRRRRAFRSEPWLVPAEGTGRLHPVVRVTFDDAGEGGARLMLPPAHAKFLDALDGRTPREASAMLAPDEARALPHLDELLTGLVNLGVVAPA